MRRVLWVVAACLCLAAAGDGAGTAGGVGLHTLPGIEPPRVSVVEPPLGTVPGLVFLAQKAGGKNQPGGPLIVDPRGRVVWFHQLPSGVTATDFRAQTYRGKPVLTWWQGRDDKSGVGFGEDVVYDASYHQIATVKAGDGLSADLHEFQLTPRGTAFITAYREVPYDLSGVGGPKRSYVYDCVVQEVDVATGKIVFDWSSLAHVPLSESLQAHEEPARDASKRRPFDYFHVNSVSDGPNGTILVSARNTSAVYLIARDGHIIWRLGGKRSDFGPAGAVRFFFQHDARAHPNGAVSLLDNGGIPREEQSTRPIVLRLNQKTKRAAVVRTLTPPSPIASPYEGNVQLLPGGGAFVDWGGVPTLTDFDRYGRVRFELRLALGDTYRGYLSSWSGDPGGRPLAARDGDVVYASWNGKVAIARWQVLGGHDAAHLSLLRSTAWKGLETAIPLQRSAHVIVVRALDAQGRVLGESKPVSR